MTELLDPALVAERVIADRVQAILDDFLAAQSERLAVVGEELAPVAEAVRDFVLCGGKRLRPAFCVWGWMAAGGPDVDEIVVAAACLELLHACALIHDDVMDASDTRRGQPAVHRRFAELHAAQGWHGESARFGMASAILLGDLCLVWADRLLDSCGLAAAALRRGRPLYDEMRVELMAGQYLDVLDQARGRGSLQQALKVARYKAAKYTVERPLHFGGLLAAASPPLLAAFTAYGLPLGEAFQLRDDLLGVYGDPQVTGKPAGDDLRQGKRTALSALAIERADPEQADLLRRHLGDPALDGCGLAAVRRVIEATGARAAVEALIAARVTAAVAALGDAPIDRTARAALRRLAATATARRV